jgi:hypothetical protein
MQTCCDGKISSSEIQWQILYIANLYGTVWSFILYKSSGNILDLPLDFIWRDFTVTRRFYAKKLNNHLCNTYNNFNITLHNTAHRGFNVLLLQYILPSTSDKTVKCVQSVRNRLVRSVLKFDIQKAFYLIKHNNNMPNFEMCHLLVIHLFYVFQLHGSYKILC